MTSGLKELAHWVERLDLGKMKTRDLRHCTDSTKTGQSGFSNGEEPERSEQAWDSIFCSCKTAQ